MNVACDNTRHPYHLHLKSHLAILDKKVAWNCLNLALPPPWSLDPAGVEDLLKREILLLSLL